MTDKSAQATLIKLLAVAKELHEKHAAIIAEMDAILGGKVGIGAKLKQVEAAWQAAWSARHRSAYVFNYKRDVPAMKRLLGKFTVEELQDRISGYIRDEEIGLIKNRHPFGWFEGSVNKYAPAAADDFGLEADAPSGCEHHPPCRSDAEHTRKRSAEMRA